MFSEKWKNSISNYERKMRVLNKTFSSREISIFMKIMICGVTQFSNYLFVKRLCKKKKKVEVYYSVNENYLGSTHFDRSSTDILNVKIILCDWLIDCLII